MSSNVQFAISAINKSEAEFKQLNRDLKKTQKEGKKAATVWDRFGKQAESAAGRAGVFGETLARLGPIGLGAGAAIGAVTAAIGTGTMSMAEWEKRLGRTEALLKSTGYAAGLTARDLDNLARERDLVTLGDRNQIMDAINVMQTFRSVSGDTFRESIALAQDMSVVTGQSLTSATTMLGKALEDPIKGLNSMRRVGVSFTETEQEVIKAMTEANDIAGAQAKIMEVLRGQFEGAAEGEAVALLGALDTLSYEWRDLMESMEQTDAAVSGVSVLIDVVRDLQFAVRDTFGEFSIEDQASQLESAIERQKQSIEVLRDEAVELPILDAWIGKSANLEKAQEELRELESQLARIKALQEGKDLRDTFVTRDKGKADADQRAKDYAVLDQEKLEREAEKQKEAEKAKAEKLAKEKERLEKKAAAAQEREEKAREKRLSDYREQLDELRLGKEYASRQRIEEQYQQMLTDGVSQTDADFWKGKQIDSLTDRMLENVDKWSVAFGDFGSDAEFVFRDLSANMAASFSTGNKYLDRFIQRWIELKLVSPLEDAVFGGGGGGSGLFGSIGNAFSGVFASIFHDGGVVGGESAPARFVPADLFRNAPRMHSGGIIGVNEQLIIGQKGELVLNAAQQANVADQMQGGQMPPVIVQLIGQDGRIMHQTQSQPMFNGNAFVTKENVAINFMAAANENTHGLYDYLRGGR